METEVQHSSAHLSEDAAKHHRKTHWDKSDNNESASQVGKKEMGHLSEQ